MWQSAMRRAAIFILSDVRSGSTLVDQCLGAHTDIVSLGEAHWLTAYLSQDRSIYDPKQPLVCTCGEPVRDCPFWNQVGRALGRPLDTLKLGSGTTSLRSRGDMRSKIRGIARRFLRIEPRLFRCSVMQDMLDGPRIARDSADLYDAVAAVTGCKYCVDSSKSPFRFRVAYCLDSERTIAIVLTRDFRAVVRSKMKRGHSLESAALGWRRKMEQIDALTKDLPAKDVYRLTFESFCENPRSELMKLCSFLDVEFSDAMLQRPTGNTHHIGGSPSKFIASQIDISLDKSYENSFSGEALDRLRKVIGDVAGKWGY